MLFYRTSPDYRLASRGGVAALGGFAPGSPSHADSAATLRATWMIKSFVTGIALLGLAYWLVQIAGAQYLATLTSATLLSFLLVYIVWCLTVRRRQHPQSPDSAATVESVSGPTVAVRPPAPLNPALKHYGVPPRDCSPPPSYEEVLRQMGIAATSSPPILYEDTLPTSSSSAPCHAETPDVPPGSRTPTAVSPSIETSSHGSPSLDTPPVRTPSLETLSICTPRLGMLSVGLSPERTSPVETAPDSTFHSPDATSVSISTSSTHTDRDGTVESPECSAEEVVPQDAISIESISIEIPPTEVPASLSPVVTSKKIKYTDQFV